MLTANFLVIAGTIITDAADFHQVLETRGVVNASTGRHDGIKPGACEASSGIGSAAEFQPWQG